MANETLASLWLRCPICTGKTRTKVRPNTVLVDFPLYCPKCKKEYTVTVAQSKILYSYEPDA